MNYLISVFLIISGCFYFTPYTYCKQLEFSKVKHYQISIEEDVYGVQTFNDKVWTVPRRGSFFISSEYDANAVDYRSAFKMGNRETALAERIIIPGEEKNKGTWRGPIYLTDYLVIIDADNLRLFGYHIESKTFTLPSDLIIDQLMAPNDSRGQATKSEVKALRSKLLKEFDRYKSGYSVISGLSSVYEENSRKLFFVATRLPSFPLIQAQCELNKKPFCSFKTACYLSEHRWTKNNPMDRSGLAYSGKRRQILIGSKIQRKIYIYAYHSCYDVRYVGHLELPKEIKELSAIHIDADDALWIASSEPDPYTNGSVFKWNRGDW